MATVVPSASVADGWNVTGLVVIGSASGTFTIVVDGERLVEKPSSQIAARLAAQFRARDDTVRHATGPDVE